MKTIPFNFKSGIITHNTWSFNDRIAPAKQLWCYGEDLIRVEYKKNLTLDISWWQNGENTKGCFVVKLIKGFNWEAPLIRSFATSLLGLKRTVNKAVALAENINSIQSKRGG